MSIKIVEYADMIEKGLRFIRGSTDIFIIATQEKVVEKGGIKILRWDFIRARK